MNISLKLASLKTTAIAVVLIGATGVGVSQPFGPGGPGARGPGWNMPGPGTMMGPGPYGPGMMGPRGAFMCNPGTAGFAEWRIDRLEAIIKPNDAQRAKFDELKAAAAKAAEAMRNACPTGIPTTMIGRMEQMEKRSEAMLAAVKTMRPALEAFYATLTAEQKTRFDSSAGPRRFWRWRDR